MSPFTTTFTTLLVSCLLIGSDSVPAVTMPREDAKPTSVGDTSVSIDGAAHASAMQDGKHDTKASPADVAPADVAPIARSMIRKDTQMEPAPAAEIEVQHDQGGAETKVQDDAKAQTKVQDDAHQESSPPSPPTASSDFPFDSDEEEDIALDELETMTIWNAFSQKHPRDCVMSDWEPKCDKKDCEDCSVTCGGGECTQTRYAKVTKNAGGKACPSNLAQDVKCNKDACPTTTTTTATTTMTTTAGGLRMVDFTLMPFFCLWILVSK